MISAEFFLAIDCADGWETSMSLVTELPFFARPGDVISFCDCCDGLKIEDHGWGFNIPSKTATYFIVADWKDTPLERCIEHFAKCGFVETKGLRQQLKSRTFPIEPTSYRG